MSSRQNSQTLYELKLQYMLLRRKMKPAGERKRQTEDIESFKQRFVEIVMKCRNDYPVSPEDEERLKKLQMPANESAKCLLACTYKGTGMMDDQGMLSVEGVNELARKFLSEDPELMKKAEKFTVACKSVNDVEVSDGNKGCERAVLIFICNIKKAPQFYLIK